MLEQVSSARLNDPAALAEASLLARRYMSHFSRKDVQEIAGDCSANVESVFNSQARMLFYLIQSEARRSIWNLWLYKHEDILINNNASIFNHLLTTKTRILLHEAYDKIPRGFAAACRRMRACTLSDYDLLHRVLSADDGAAIARELGQKNISIDRKALEFIDRSPFSMSYTVALFLSRYDKLEELSCLAKVCSPAESKSLQLLLKRSAYGSYEELASEMLKWREKLVFPGVPIIPASDSDFQMVRTEASLKTAGRKWRNCLQTSYRRVYGQALHRGTQQIHIFKRKLLFSISLSHNTSWVLQEVDEGKNEDPDLVLELKNRLISYGVKIEKPYTVADAIANLAEGSDFLSDWDF